MRKTPALALVAVCACWIVGFQIAGQSYAPLVVSGAGSPDANGTYTFTGLQNGKPAYEKGIYSVVWVTSPSTYWKIGRTGFVIDFYCNLSDTPTPPAGGWMGGCGAMSEGVLPYPTTSGGEETTPEIDVRGSGLSIPDGDSTPSSADLTDFGTTGVTSGSVDHTFSIHNTGTGGLTLALPITVSGGADFTVTTQPASSVAPGDSTSFVVRFDATAGGLRTAIVQIGNGDADENPYTFSVEGMGDGTGPTVTGIAANVALVADAHVGAGTFTLTVDYDEPMNASAPPVVTLAPDVSSTLQASSQGWLDVDSYRVTYNVADAQVDVNSVTADASGAQDVYGNPQQDYAAQHEMEIDTLNPSVLSVAADTAFVRDSDLTQQVSVTFSEAMSAASVPAVVFSSGAWVPGAAGVWSGGNTVWTRSYTLTDANATVTNVTIDVSGARDVAGNLQQDYAPQPEFSIDTQNPTVTGVASSDARVTDSDAGGSMTVTADFSEAMSSGATPTFVFSPAIATTLAFSSGAWLDADTYRATYAVSDGNVDHDAVSVDVINAADAAGNGQVDYASATEFEIDTQNPTVTIAANDVAIYDGDVGVDRFVVTATYSEVMDPAAAPAMVFLPGMATTFTNPSAAWSGGNTVYTWTYDVVDDGALVLDVDLYVSGGADVAGNTQVAALRSDYVDVDLQNPTVTGVAASDARVTDGDAGGSVTITADFSEAMNSGATPTFVFAPSIATTLSFSSGVWLDVDTYRATYAVSDGNVDHDAVSVDVINAADAAGNGQVDYAPATEFEIDTQNPTVTIAANDVAIYDGDAGADRFVVTATFSEAMNPAVVPTLAFSPAVGTTLTSPSGAWSGGNTAYTWTYDVVDAGVTEADVDLTVSGGADTAGNGQVPGTRADYVDIDTQNPTVTITTNDGAIYDGDVGVGRFAVTATFSEAMNPAVVPALVFSPAVATTFTNPGGAWSGGNTAYTWTYDVADAGVTEADVDLTVSGGADVAGNGQVPGTRADSVDIDTRNPIATTTVDRTLVSGGSPIYGGGLVLTVTVTYDEPMNTATAPTITLENAGTHWGAQTPLGWTGNTVYRATFTHSGAEEPSLPATAIVAFARVASGSGARDLAGNVDVGDDSAQFEIDTRRPRATVTVDRTLVSGGAPIYEGALVLTVTVTYDEPMDAATEPTITLQNAGAHWGSQTALGWTGSTVYRATFTHDGTEQPTLPATATTAYARVASVSGARDLAGNTDVGDDSPAFQIDTRKPRATVTVNRTLVAGGSPIYEAALVLTVTVTYDEAMNTATSPTIALENAGVHWGPQTPLGWTGSTVYRATFTHDGTQEPDLPATAITATVRTANGSGARDLAGNADVGDESPNFQIDTRKPTVVAVTLSDHLITDADVGQTFTVTVDYDESMQAGAPTIAFVPALPTTLSLLGSSGWADSDTYVARYAISDGGVTVDDDDVEIAQARDLAGNAQAPSSRGDDLDVDTENPVIDGFTVTGGQVGTKDGNDCVREVTFAATVTDPNGHMVPNDITITSATVRTNNASIGSPYDVDRAAQSDTVATISGTVDAYDLRGCPAIVRVVLDARDSVGNPAQQASQEDGVYDAIDPTIHDFSFSEDATHITPTDEYEVNPCCVTTVYFSARVSDNCCVAAANIGVAVTLPTRNAVLENVVWTATQAGQKEVDVAGSADVRCLTSCFARVEVTITAYDCCGNPAVSLTSTADEGLIWDRLAPEPLADPNGYEAERCDGLEVRRDDLGQCRLMIRENTPTYLDVLCNDSDNCSACSCCGRLWIYDIVSAPEFGTATVVDSEGNCNGGTSLRYAPNRGYLGPDHFTYRIVDACGNVSDVATVYLQTTREVDLEDVYVVACGGRPAEIRVTMTDLWIDPDRPRDVPFALEVMAGPRHGVLWVDPSAVTYSAPSTSATGGVVVPTLTLMESLTATLAYTAASGYVGRDGVRLAFRDPYGGAVLGNVDIAVGACADVEGSAPIRAPHGHAIVFIPPATFRAAANALPEGLTLTSTADGRAYPDAVTVPWSEEMARSLVLVDTTRLPGGRYLLSLPLGNGDVVEALVEVGETP